MSPRILLCAALGASVALAGCGGHGGTVPASVSSMAVRPPSVSPAFVKAAPMAKTRLLPASAMRSPADRHVDSIGRSWTQLPGSASQVAAAPDGSLWVLSQEPAGSADKYIWHYANGTWQNISGMATQLAVPPAAGNNFLYAVNAGGGVWVYNETTSTWFPIGGGVKSISLDMSGSLYAVSNASSGDAAIWEYPSGPSSQWQQIGGSGVIVSGETQDGTVPLASGAIGPNPGTFILNSQGQIWYENATSPPTYGSLPGAASALAMSSNGNGGVEPGVFVLSYPANASGNAIYFYDFYMPGWVREAGAGTGISTDGTTLYVVGGSNAIYKTTAQGLLFAGGTTSASFTSSGGSYTFPASGSYNNVSVHMTWGANDTSASFPVTVNWAYGSDLAASFAGLPSTDGTALVYMDLLPGVTGKVSFTQTPAVTVTTTTSFPGTKCGFAFFGSLGAGAPTWNVMTALGLAEASPSGNSFTIPAQALPPGNGVELNAGQDMFFALYCH